MSVGLWLKFRDFWMRIGRVMDFCALWQTYAEFCPGGDRSAVWIPPSGGAYTHRFELMKIVRG